MIRALRKLSDAEGYDPYNHVGCDMQPELKPLPHKDSVFLMSMAMQKKLCEEFMLPRSMISDIPRIRHDTLMGARVMTTPIFPSCDA